MGVELERAQNRRGAVNIFLLCIDTVRGRVYIVDKRGRDKASAVRGGTHGTKNHRRRYENAH